MRSFLTALTGLSLLALSGSFATVTPKDDEAAFRALLDYYATELRDKRSVCVHPPSYEQSLDPMWGARWTYMRLAANGPAMTDNEINRKLAGAATHAAPQILLRWLRKPLRLAGNRRCSAAIMFSNPAMNGDMAFVVVVRSCGDGCGNGERILLRRNGSKWYPEAQQKLWFS